MSESDAIKCVPCAICGSSGSMVHKGLNGRAICDKCIEDALALCGRKAMLPAARKVEGLSAQGLLTVRPQR